MPLFSGRPLPRRRMHRVLGNERPLSTAPRVSLEKREFAYTTGDSWQGPLWKDDVEGGAREVQSYGSKEHDT
jgi:hypothetical protein